MSPYIMTQLTTSASSALRAPHKGPKCKDGKYMTQDEYDKAHKAFRDGMQICAECVPESQDPYGRELRSRIAIPVDMIEGSSLASLAGRLGQRAVILIEIPHTCI